MRQFGMTKVAALLCLLAMVGCDQEPAPRPGRYQVVASSGTAIVVKLDTATGATWRLIAEDPDHSGGTVLVWEPLQEHAVSEPGISKAIEDADTKRVSERRRLLAAES